MGQKETETDLDIIKSNAVQNNYEHITVTKCGGGLGGGRERKKFEAKHKEEMRH